MNPNIQSCIIDPWPRQWPHTVCPEPQWPVPTYNLPQPAQHTHYHFTPNPQPQLPLTDYDVERIAKRLAELLKEKP